MGMIPVVFMNKAAADRTRPDAMSLIPAVIVPNLFFCCEIRQSISTAIKLNISVSEDNLIKSYKKSTTTNLVQP